MARLPLLLLLLLLCLPSGAAANASSGGSSMSFGALPPTPQPLSPYQQQYMEGVRARAKAASQAATPAVLAALDDAELRAALRTCCPGIATLSAAELLDWYERAIGVSELVHNFNAAPPAPGQRGHGGDPDLAVYSNSTWFFNLCAHVCLRICRRYE